MSLAETEDIEEFADRVRNELGGRVEKVILFGSYARDEHVPGSDIDMVFLLSEENSEDEKKVWTIAEEFQAEKDLMFSPKLYEEGEFSRKFDEGYSFYKGVIDEGLEI
ncbi:MAG: nucleotidyltransferase domain-containing protein [Candidatus Nanohaloarchaea archaeon]